MFYQQTQNLQKHREETIHRHDEHRRADDRRPERDEYDTQEHHGHGSTRVAGQANAERDGGNVGGPLGTRPISSTREDLIQHSDARRLRANEVIYKWAG